MLYSKNGEYPSSLPFRIRMNDGSTRTDPSSFTEEELTSIGYAPAPDMPPYNPDTQHAEWDGTTLSWSIVDYTQEELDAIAQAKVIEFWQKNKLNRIQFEFMVEKLNLTSAIEAAIAALPETTEQETNAKIMAKVLFKSGQEFERLHPLFAQLAPAVGLTDQQLDEIWLQAKSV